MGNDKNFNNFYYKKVHQKTPEISNNNLFVQNNQYLDHSKSRTNLNIQIQNNKDKFNIKKFDNYKLNFSSTKNIKS